MKTLVLSLLAGLLFVNPAFAEKKMDIFVEPHMITDDFLAYGSTLLGRDVYISPIEAIPESVIEVPAEWDHIGNLDDIILKKNGQVYAAIIDVGGFLGIGTRSIAIRMEALHMVDMSRMDDFYIVLASDKQHVENAPEYVHHEIMGRPFSRTLYPVRPYGRPDIHPLAGYERLETSTVSVSDLKAARVYGANHQEVASVSNVLVTPEGTVEQVIIDVGGFLGIGSRSVAFEIDELELHSGPLDLRIYLPMTEEELQDKPEYTE
ncbi:PRC-barrel domain-containing protein [Desulfonatronum thioautotrophicum]|uniref:PRC-barrel domain-containing protein n=1 Tax=Desulfonatronum thioautotrophicum TaxID=617001 RepID=UPI0005EB07D0|nr:PRC-barrel domain-containing protein [Desulfonatronum thioautotrophicum]